MQSFATLPTSTTWAPRSLSRCAFHHAHAVYDHWRLAENAQGCASLPMPSTCSQSPVQRTLIRGVTERALVDLSESQPGLRCMPNHERCLHHAIGLAVTVLLHTSVWTHHVHAPFVLHKSLLTYWVPTGPWHGTIASTVVISTVLQHCLPTHRCQSVAEAMTQVFNTALS